MHNWGPLSSRIGAASLGRRGRGLLLGFAAVIGACVFGFGPGAARAQEQPVADVAVVSLSANVRHAKVGGEVIFTVVAANNGPDVADFALVADASLFFPNQFESSGFEILGAVECQNGPPDGASCEDNSLPPGATLTMIFHATVKPTTNKVASITSCVDSFSLIPDPNPANDCLTTSLRIVGKRNGS
jgi:Domain of unknown function DUF11